MNHKLWASVGARVIALSFVIAGVTACGEKLSNVSHSSAPATPVSPSAQVVGVAPAEPKGETAQTTEAGGRTELTVAQQQTGPREGDNHSYSTLSPVTPQKAEGVSPADARNSDSQSSPAGTTERK